MHLEVISAPALEQKDDDYLTHTTGSYLYDTDRLTESMLSDSTVTCRHMTPMLAVATEFPLPPKPNIVE